MRKEKECQHPKKFTGGIQYLDADGEVMKTQEYCGVCGKVIDEQIPADKLYTEEEVETKYKEWDAETDWRFLG